MSHKRDSGWKRTTVGCNGARVCSDGRTGTLPGPAGTGHLVTLGRARELAAQALALATGPDQPLVQLAAHRLLGEVETAAEQISAALAHLTSALDLAGVCEAPFERALTLLSLTELRLCTGEWADAA